MTSPCHGDTEGGFRGYHEDLGAIKPCVVFQTSAFGENASRNAYTCPCVDTSIPFCVCTFIDLIICVYLKSAFYPADWNLKLRYVIHWLEVDTTWVCPFDGGVYHEPHLWKIPCLD